MFLLTVYKIRTETNCIKLYKAIYLKQPKEVTNAARPSLQQKEECYLQSKCWTYTSRLLLHLKNNNSVLGLVFNKIQSKGCPQLYKLNTNQSIILIESNTLLND